MYSDKTNKDVWGCGYVRDTLYVTMLRSWEVEGPLTERLQPPPLVAPEARNDRLT